MYSLSDCRIYTDCDLGKMKSSIKHIVCIMHLLYSILIRHIVTTKYYNNSLSFSLLNISLRPFVSYFLSIFIPFFSNISPCDLSSRGKMLLGYSDLELANKGGYDLVHYDDLAYVASAHQERECT